MLNKSFFSLYLRTWLLPFVAVFFSIGLYGQGIDWSQFKFSLDSNYMFVSIAAGEWDTININRFKTKYGLTGGGGGSGTVTNIATTAPITGGPITTTGTIGITQATTSTNGYLSSTDWNTFNGKVGGSGSANRIAWWNGTNIVTSSGKLLYDNSGAKLLLGDNLDTTAAWVAQNVGLAIRGSSTSGISMIGGSPYKLWNIYMDGGTANKFAIKTDASGTTDYFKIDYTDGATYISDLGAANSAAANDRVLLGANTTGLLKALEVGTNNHVLTQTASGPAWQAASGGATNLSFSGATSPFALNSSTGTGVTFAAGTNVTLTRSGNQLTIAASGGSGNGLEDGAALVVNGLGATTISLSPAGAKNINFNNAIDWSGTNIDANSSTDQITVAGTGIYLVTFTGSLKITCGNSDGEVGLYVDGALVDNAYTTITDQVDEKYMNFSFSGIVSHTGTAPRIYEVKYLNGYPTGWQCGSATSYVIDQKGVSFMVHKIF